MISQEIPLLIYIRHRDFGLLSYVNKFLWVRLGLLDKQSLSEAIKLRHRASKSIMIHQ